MLLKKINFSLLCFFMLSLFSISFHVNHALAKEKVILDADMVDSFDDGIAMLMLAADPNIELLGVTTVTGNSWADAGTASALYQLQIAGKSDIPVAIGVHYPLRSQRHENMQFERKLFGIGKDVWMGSFGLPKPSSWQEYYNSNYDGKALKNPIKQHAVDFIIDTVRKNPNEVTIAAIGPCTNLALAINKAPDIIPLIKKVIYMGGSFYQQGNVTPAAEFNWWFDPEAARIAIRAPFKEQIIVGLDVCEKLVFDKTNYDRFLKTLDSSALSKIVRRAHFGVSFEKDPSFTHFVWDVIVSAILIDPSIVTAETNEFVDINEQFGLSYGQSLAFPINGPHGTQKVKIITEIDEEKFWNMVNDKKYWKDIVK